MHRMTIDEIHEHALELLRTIDQYSEQHSIPYYLIGGSALGAVRHSGFIPWDDDIDIGMMRADYEKFCDIFQDNDSCQLSTMRRTRHFYSPYAKLYDTKTRFVEPTSKNAPNGIFIDIFPLDYIVDSSIAIKRALARKTLYTLAFTRNLDAEDYRLEPRWKRAARKSLAKVYASQNPIEVVGSIEKCVVVEAETAQLMNLWGMWGEREVSDAAWFGEGVMMPFEDMECRIPRNWHQYLEKLYGDYMTPPQDPPKQHGEAYIL